MILSVNSHGPRRPFRGVFRSRGYLSFECHGSTDLLTLTELRNTARYSAYHVRAWHNDDDKQCVLLVLVPSHAG